MRGLFTVLLTVVSLSLTAAEPVEKKEVSFWDQLGDLAQKVTTSTQDVSIGEVLLSNDDIRKGLAAALSQGVKTAIKSLGQEDGFYKNDLLKIPVPENLKSLEKALLVIKQNKLVDDFVLRMNRAAEQATPAVGESLSNAILKLTIHEVKSILNGPKDAATQYFKKSCHDNLFKLVLPIVKEFTEKSGATKTYKKALNKTGFILQALGRADDFDLDKYVTTKALDGLYQTIASEEKRIRDNPAARTTDILKKVFGTLTK